MKKKSSGTLELVGVSRSGEKNKREREEERRERKIKTEFTEARGSDLPSRMMTTDNGSNKHFQYKGAHLGAGCESFHSLHHCQKNQSNLTNTQLL